MSKLSAFLLEHSRIISFFSIVGSAALFAIAASLSIVLLVSGSDDGVLEHCNIVTVSLHSNLGFEKANKRKY